MVGGASRRAGREWFSDVQPAAATRVTAGSHRVDSVASVALALPPPSRQVVLKAIRPYTRVRIPFIASQLNVPATDVEQLLISLILDGRVAGRIDQVHQVGGQAGPVPPSLCARPAPPAFCRCLCAVSPTTWMVRSPCRSSLSCPHCPDNHLLTPLARLPVQPPTQPSHPLVHPSPPPSPTCLPFRRSCWSWTPPWSRPPSTARWTSGRRSCRACTTCWWPSWRCEAGEPVDRVMQGSARMAARASLSPGAALPSLPQPAAAAAAACVAAPSLCLPACTPFAFVLPPLPLLP